MLPEGWMRNRLGQVAIAFAGGTPPRAREDFFRGNIPWIKSGEVNKGYIDHAEEHISQAALKESSAKMAPRGSVLVAMYGATAGAVGRLGIDAAINQAVLSVNGHSEKADNGFLFFSLSHLSGQLLNSVQGSGQPNLSKGLVEDAEILLPPLPEQRRIAEILGSVDAAIGATKAVIEQTKTVKQGLLQNLLTRGIGHTEFKDSPLGEIPQSWEVKPLGEVLTLQRGIDLPVQSRRSGEVPIYGSNGIVGYHNSAPFNGIGVITGRSGTIGTVFVSEVPYHPLNTTLHVVEFFGNSPRFCSFLLEFVDLKQFVAATGVPTLNRNFVHPHQVALPPIDEQEVIANTLMDVGEQIEQEERVLASLKTLKKGLMDDLLTGKVRVNLPEKVAA